MLEIRNIPIEVYWRALDLFGEEREDTIGACADALHSAEGRKDHRSDIPGITPFAQAIAEYMSVSGPFDEESGEFAGVNGYSLGRANQ